MNPALLNYLQNSQLQGSLEAPRQNMVAPDNAGQPPYNPFDAGIQKAISSARESLGMTDKQQEKALRRAMLSFGENIGQQPKQRGLLNNFASVGRALAPAISAYDQEEEGALAQNNNMANQILAYKAAEEAKQAQAEERAWRRQYAEAQLGETRRAHDLMNQRHHPNMQGSMAPNALAVNEGFIPIESKSERLMYSKDKKASGEILKELSSIKNDYDKFKKLSETDVINPMAPYGLGKIANTGKDFFGYFTDDKNLREETRKRKALDAKLGKFALELERKMKGGVLSEGMVKRFENKGLLPSLGDAPDVFEEKLNNLMQEMTERYKASDASLRYGIHISPYDLEQLENNISDQNQDTDINSGENNQDYIVMLGPDNIEYDVPASKQKLYEDNNYRIIE